MFPTQNLPVYRSWQQAINSVLVRAPHENVSVNKSGVEPPYQIGCIRALGEPVGQIADWSRHLSNNGRLHIIEYPTFYKLHWDIIDPISDPAGHIEKDAPHWKPVIIGSIALGFFIGLLGLLTMASSKQ